MTPLIYGFAGILLGCFVTGLVGAACAMVFMQKLRQELSARLQQAIQVELEYRAQRQLERDETLTQAQRRWRAEQEARRAEDMRALIEALETRSGKPIAPGGAAKQPASPRPAPAPIASSAVAMSARPPELMYVPLPRPEIGTEPEQPELELSDEEIDALPPELPGLAKPRKRLPAPAKPPLRGI